MARISRWVVPKYPHPITREYLFHVRFRSYVLHEKHFRAAAASVDWNSLPPGIVKKAWVYPRSSDFFHGAQQQEPDRERSGIWRLGKEVGRILDGGDVGKGSSDTADDPNRAAGGESSFGRLGGTFNGSASFWGKAGEAGYKG